MPELTWIGKDKVINHHLDVPFRTLERQYSFDEKGEHKEDNGSANMIIHGDNLEALKALLPKYEGRINVAFLDPPYNTGNMTEGSCFVYEDNVNDPLLKKWFGEVVGKEGEDFARHDKWLCMMYPRLKLIHKLLADDGVIFITIDDNEEKYLHLIMDEIFGPSCFIQNMIWKNKYGPGALTKGIGNVHEYILCYSKTPIESVKAPLSEDEIKKYKAKDQYYEIRGGYITQPLATKSKDDRPNLVYPVHHDGEEIWPDKQWIWEKKRLYSAIERDEVVFNKTEDKWSVRFKQYLRDENGITRYGKPISILTGPFNQEGTKEIERIFGKRVFNNPKPVNLVQYLFSFIFNDKSSKEYIYLDSFAGSGTTASAVLNMNKSDGGNRRFVLCELGDYADNITAERIKKTISGYGKESSKVEGTGGNFSYYELGPTLFLENGSLNPEIDDVDIMEYVWYSETGRELKNTSDAYLGKHNNIGYYFFRNKTFNYKVLATIKDKAESYVVYAEKCAFSEEELSKYNITFKKIPRDIRRV